jgi:HAD superfamily hydrolase (TIGR01509 family)
MTRGLLVDWGGVLTVRLDDALRLWCESEGMPYQEVMDLLDWYAPAEGETHPIHSLERGESDQQAVAEWIAREVQERHGVSVDANGLLDRMFAHLTPYDGILDLCHQARRAGWATAVLSNSWDNIYPRDRWGDAFDLVVISGEVGMRKPEERIFRHALQALDVEPVNAVFVDDEMPNINVARSLGMQCVYVADHAAAEAELRAMIASP